MPLRNRKRFQSDIQVTRRGPLVRVKGRKQKEQTPEVFTIKGGVQPAAAKDMKRLPEGTRTDSAVTLRTSEDLILTEPDGKRADRITPLNGGVYEGVEFEIQSVKEWPGHREYLAIKTGQ